MNLEEIAKQAGLSVEDIQEQAREEARRKLGRKKLFFFTQYTFQEYRIARHLELISSYMDKWIQGEIKRLIITAPPRHGKTELVSVRTPALIFGQNPRANIMVASSVLNRATKKSRACKSVMRSNAYQRLFPNVRVSETRDSMEEWETEYFNEEEQIWENGGNFLCCGVEGSIAGEGFEYGIIDDPVKGRVEAESITVQKRTLEWYISDFYTRMNTRDSRILLMHTRWHPNDLVGKLLRMMLEEDNADQWTILDLKALAEEGDILGRVEGEALWPSFRSREDLLKIKAQDFYSFSSLYQQNPISKESSKIDATKIDIVEEAPKGIIWIRAVDLAVSSKKSADYTATAAIGFDEEEQIIYVKDMLREQLSWPRVRGMLKTLAASEKYPIAMEDVGLSKGFIEELEEDEIFGSVGIIPVKVISDKLTRALPWISKVDVRRLKFVRGTWNDEALEELAMFTGRGDKHDDQVDCISIGYTAIREWYVGDASITWV